MNDGFIPELTFANGASISQSIIDQLTVYHSDQWLSLLAEFYGYQPSVHSVTKDGKVVALGSLVSISNLTGKKLCSPPASMYGHLLADSIDDLNSLLEQIASASVDGQTLKTLLLDTPPYMQSTPYLYMENEEHDYIIKLDDEDLAWKRMHSSARRAVRKSRKECVEVLQGGKEWLDDFFALYVITRRRLKLPVAPKRWLAKLLDSGLARLLIARHHEETVAGILYLSDHRYIHYALPAYNDAGSMVRAMDACLWQLVLTGLEQGCRWLCLGGTPLDNDGLVQFKKKWGGQVRSIYSYSSSPSSWLSEQKPRSGHRKFKHGGQLISHLPTPLLECLGYTYLRYIV
ncbi:lipid II:glycine glycyltransferase FemX [Reinekea marinisedimentorum]|uniref:Acetyltransferase (GNAT) family protein n=1 Tax=Reinekea marinisedimentorum TaxID=230495 RepID=A0A4V2UJW6_9GAMM|nr:GNAT family N-acetyltransferase [Reinekea marinisedimentorum]TCS41698.1 acetyltransferase (GNAT) family protein [Reinekea marinisedimentorum]